MSIIGLKKANCKNCYKCVKVCPVKSIKVENEQAQIVDRTCILCGTCLEQCPQDAKTVNSDAARVREMLRAGEKVILSVAPSYIACYSMKEPERFTGAMKALGFFGVSETSEGAAYVTAEYHKLLREGTSGNLVTTCCPSFNRLVEIYYPDLVGQLTPVVSPMIAHARLLKSAHPGVKVVFAGPCIAKMDEAGDPRHNNEVDAVLTFEDLDRWMMEERVSFDRVAPERFLNSSSKILRMYPVEEGILASLKNKGDTGDWQMLSVSGSGACVDLCKALQAGLLNHCFIEVNMCRDGCINGPASGRETTSRFRGRLQVERYAREDGEAYPALLDEVPLRKRFFDHSVKEDLPDEATIRAILAKIGKNGPEDELNCGSCGYPTCRDKAIAVYQNRAELTMCVPYMKERAESFSNCLLSGTPNMTIMVDEELRIVEFNAAAERVFGISRHEALEKYLYELMDSSDFEEVLSSRRSMGDKKVEFREYGMVTAQNIVYVEREKIAMGIFKDITQEEKELENKYRLRAETVVMAQKVIDKQMIAAQQIASLLGETTAETKVSLTKLKNMMVAGEDQK